MNNTVVLAISLALMLGIFTSCKEDLKTNRELLTEPTWKFSTATGTDSLSIALSLVFLNGVTQTYAEDGTYALEIPSVSDSQTGTWELDTDDVTLTLDKGTEDESIVGISELTESILTYTETDSAGTLNLTFTAVE